MAVSTFAVTYLTVRAHELPFLDEFSASSNPTSTSIGTFIDQAAAKLQGKLAQKGVTASAITDTASAPYLWCQQTLTLDVALRILRVMTNSYPEHLKRIAEELAERWKDLEENGATALGDESLDDSEDSPPDGPHTHISELDLSVGDDPAGDASDAAPLLRQNDVL